MFVRYRETPYRLQLSLVETRRVNGKVRHEHVASLGSVETPPTVAGRIAFWQRLHQRLAQLGNRLDGEAQAKVLGAVHARVPMVTADEQRALQLEHAKADAKQWAHLHDMHAGTVEDYKGLAATVATEITKGEAHAAQAEAHAKTAQDRVERIERGENVEGGLGQPVAVEQILRRIGLTTRDMNHARLLASVPDESISNVMDASAKASVEASQRASESISRRIAREALKALDDAAPDEE